MNGCNTSYCFLWYDMIYNAHDRENALADTLSIHQIRRKYQESFSIWNGTYDGKETS